MRVTVQQAAANALAAWLAMQMSDVVVEPRWPAPDKKRPAKSITVVTAGARRDTPIDLRQIQMTNSGPKQVQTTWQLAACTQPFQLDVWANTDVDRDDILARLDDFLHAGEQTVGGLFVPTPVGFGNLLKLADGWDAFGTIADFVFDNPNLEQTADAAGRALYRATFRGNAYFMLTVSTLTARQLAINFVQRISETDPITDSDLFP